MILRFAKIFLAMLLYDIKISTRIIGTHGWLRFDIFFVSGRYIDVFEIYFKLSSCFIAWQSYRLFYPFQIMFIRCCYKPFAFLLHKKIIDIFLVLRSCFWELLKGFCLFHFLTKTSTILVFPVHAFDICRG